MTDWRFSDDGDKIDFEELRIAVGDYPRISGQDKFGFNNDLGTSEETVWDTGGIYSYPDIAVTMTLSSDDATDDEGGTGAITVEVDACAAGYLPILETFTLNGQSGVTVTPDVLRVNRLKVKSAGSGGINAGNIYLGTGAISSGAPANIFAQISVGQGQTLMALYTVPVSNSVYLFQPIVTSSRVAAASVDARLIVRPFGEVFQVKRRFIVSTSGGPSPAPRRFLFKVNEKSDMEIRATGSNPNMDVSAELEFLKVDWS